MMFKDILIETGKNIMERYGPFNDKYTDTYGWKHIKTSSASLLIDTDSNSGNHFTFLPKSKSLHATFNKGKQHIHISSNQEGLDAWNIINNLYGGLERKTVLYGDEPKPKYAYEVPKIEWPKIKIDLTKCCEKILKSITLPEAKENESLKLLQGGLNFQENILPKVNLFEPIEISTNSFTLSTYKPPSQNFDSSFSWNAYQEHWLGKSIPEKSSWNIDGSPDNWPSPVLSPAGNYDDYTAPVREAQRLVDGIIERNSGFLDSLPPFNENEFLKDMMITPEPLFL